MPGANSEVYLVYHLISDRLSGLPRTATGNDQMSGASAGGAGRGGSGSATAADAHQVLRGRRFGSQTLIDWLFGYDFFLSYSHADGQRYILALKKALEAKGFRICVDLAEFTVGDSIGAITQRRVRMSRRLVLICRPAALRSRYVRQEVETFAAKGGRLCLPKIMSERSSGVVPTGLER